MAKKSEMIGFKTTPEIKAALERIAETEDRTISYIINKILEEHLKLKGNLETPVNVYNLIGDKPVITPKPAAQKKNLG